MASTSLTLSPHWEDFIEAEVRSGRYASASEVMRAALRELEDKRRRMDLLQAHLQEVRIRPGGRSLWPDLTSNR